MLQTASQEISERILICAPYGRDAELLGRELVRAQLSPFQCASLKDLCRHSEDGAGAALISDYAFGPHDVALLAETLARQPPWSALPVLVLISGEVPTRRTRAVFRELQAIGSLTLLERPLRPNMLLSSVRAAIQNRCQQYQIRDYVRHLEESEKTLQTYFDNTGDGLCILDCQTGRILDINQRAVERSGYSRKELLGLVLPDIFVERGPIEAALRDILRAEAQGIVTLEGTKRRKDGSTYPVAVRMTSLAPNLPTQVLAVICDITEAKQLEQERREGERRKDEFLALLGHEMRNPLAAISTSLDVLSGKCPPAQRRQLLKAAVREVGIMRRLMDDLLDLSRIAHGQISLRKESLGLREFLERAAAEVKPIIAERRQKLSVRLPSKPVRFVADRVRLAQVAGNLLVNASKYTGPGGRIELSGALEDSHIVLRCKDNGQGIPPEFADSIFKPFIQGHEGRDSYGEGSLGIGLALVKQLAQLHGGTVAVKSGGTGKGSEFTVRLPRIRPPSRRHTTAPEPKATRAAQRACTIVIVEDNPVVAASTKIALEVAGHRVRVFPDGPHALAGIAGLKPDAFVLDIGLPGMDGYELAARLKRKKEARSALFIAVSGFKRNRRTEEEGAHFDHYFIKPVKIGKLLTLFSEHPNIRAGGKISEKHPKPKKQMRPQRPRVLLVEDHPFTADATASLLRLEGLFVRTAHTGREAIEIAQKYRPQLILCDLRLGDMKGFDVIRAIRSNPSARGAQAVTLTGFSGSEIQEFKRKANEFGVDDFISKPLEPAMIRKLVSQLKTKPKP